MPINLQGSGPITEGWGSAPQLQGRDLGHTVASILADRLQRQQDQQKLLAEGIKRFQEQRQGEAYAEMLRNTGLSEGQDFSGLSAADMTRMAQLLQQRTPDTLRDEVLKAQARLYNARADDVNDPDPGTLDPAEQRRQDAEKRREENDRLKALKDQMKLSEVPSDAVPHPLAHGETVQPGTYPFDVAGKRQDIPQSRIDQFNAARRAYDEMTKQRSGVSPGKSTSGVSSGGTPLASRDEIRMARARQAMDDPQATPAEKEQARKILAGE